MVEAPGCPQSLAKVRICCVDEIPPGLGRAFCVDDVDIAVFRSRGGTVQAMHNRCPHRGGPLAEGMLAGNRVVCPLHAYRFDLDTGECDAPSVCGAGLFKTEVCGGDVFVFIPNLRSAKN